MNPFTKVGVKTLSLLAIWLGFSMCYATLGFDQPKEHKSSHESRLTTSRTFPRTSGPASYAKAFFTRENESPETDRDTLSNEPMPQKPVIRLMGLDAVGWPVLNKLLRTEQFPGFKHLVCSSTCALFLTDVGNTAVSCTTITTGKERFKHGILNHDEAGGRSPFDYTWRAVKVARLWQMLQYHNLSVITGGFILADDRNQVFRSIDQVRRLHTLPDYNAIITFYIETDAVLHDTLMPFLMTHSAWGQEYRIDQFWDGYTKRAVDQVLTTFSEVDTLIEELLTRYPQDILIVFSDHGQRPTAPSNRFAPLMPIILRKHDVTELQENVWLIDKSVRATVRYYEKMLGFAVNPKDQKEISGYLLIPHLQLETVDAHRQAARKDTAQNPLGLNLPVFQNRNDRLLWNLRQELFSYRDHKHHLFIPGKDDDLVLSQDLINYMMIENENPKSIRQFSGGGEHDYRNHGILIAYGPPFRKGAVTDPLSLVDLTPTVLFAAGLPVGRDMDGRVAEELFRSEFRAEHSISFVDSYDSLVEVTAAPGERRQLSPDELRLYKQRGYPGLP